MNSNRTTLAVSCFTALLILSAMCLYQLRSNEVAIITSFGQATLQEEPGLHLRLPWPLQKIQTLDQRKKLYEGTMRETRTKDDQNLILRTYATWEIADPMLFYTRSGKIKDAEKQLKNIIDSIQDNDSRNFNFADYLNGVDKLSEIENRILTRANEQSLKTLGIRIVSVGIAQQSMLESASKGILDRMKEELQLKTAELKAKGEQEAQMIRNEADFKKDQELASARAKAQSLHDSAFSDAVEEYKDFSKEEIELAIFMRKLEALKAVTRTKTTIIASPDMPPFDLLKQDKGKELNK